uniref:BTB/POZ domain-containing protein n=1 Tax=Lepisosteus oculatus TaxID=7918 RepID=W5MI15_LEPOC
TTSRRKSGPWTTELAAQSSSETSTPEELKDYDSSSGTVSPGSPVPVSCLGKIKTKRGIFFPLEQECKEQQQQQNKTAPVAVLLSPSSALSTIYEAMETTDEEEEGEGVWIRREGAEDQERPDPQRPLLELDWVNKAEMVQQLINQTLLLAGERCPLLLTGSGGTLSPLESSRWPELLSPLDPPGASITAVTSYSPEDHGCSQGDWTVVELETHH